MGRWTGDQYLDGSKVTGRVKRAAKAPEGEVRKPYVGFAKPVFGAPKSRTFRISKFAGKPARAKAAAKRWVVKTSMG